MTRIITTAYQNSHGKLPRGDGYWAIETPDGKQHWFNGSVKAAAQHASDEYRYSHGGERPFSVKVLP